MCLPAKPRHLIILMLLKGIYFRIFYFFTKQTKQGQFQAVYWTPEVENNVVVLLVQSPAKNISKQRSCTSGKLEFVRPHLATSQINR